MLTLRPLIVVCLFGLVAGTAYGQPETLEEVRSALEGFRFDSYRADMNMTTNAGGMTIVMTGDMMGRGEEMAMTMKMDLMGQSMTTHTILQESGMMWIEVDNNGMKQVMKGDRDAIQSLSAGMAGLNPSALPQDSAMPSTPGAMLDAFSEMYDLTYSGVDSVEGVEVYAFEGEAKPEYKEMFRQSPQLAQMGVTLDAARFFLGKDDGFLRKVEVLMEDGTVFTTQTYSNVTLNESLPQGAFSYTPPEGVPVMDLGQQLQQQNQAPPADAGEERGPN